MKRSFPSAFLLGPDGSHVAGMDAVQASQPLARSCTPADMMHDEVIMRTIIDLPEDQVRALAELCKAQSISRAEAVRRALSDMLAKQKSAGRDAAFGAWRDKKVDSRKFVAALREEWER